MSRKRLIQIGASALSIGALLSVAAYAQNIGQQQQQGPITIPTDLPNILPSASPSPSPSPSESATPSPSPSESATPSPSPSVSATPSPSPSASANPAQSVTVTIPPGAPGMGTQAFGVNPLVIQAGTTVTWVNGDSVAHTATSQTAVWDSGPLAPGQSYSFTFNNPGTYPYYCTIHGAASMSGLIQVN